MRNRGFFAILAAALGVWAWDSAAGAIEVQPSALSLLRSGELVVQDTQLGLFLLSPATGRVQTMVGRFGPYEAQDTISAFLDGSDAIFVTMNLPASKGGGRAQLVRYSAAGARTGAWDAPKSIARLGGVAVDEKKKLVYVASSQPPEIYKLDLDRSPRSGALVRLAGIPGAERFGAMTLDVRRGRLLISDPYWGRVYGYDLASGHSEALLEKVGEINALALDAERSRLFLSDFLGGRILVAELGSKSTAAKPFTAAREFGEPLGLALDAAGGLWVGDRFARKVFQLSSTGQRLRAFPLRPIPLRAVPSLPPRQ
jgi:sugar lactone lactonase YvrE